MADWISVKERLPKPVAGCVTSEAVACYSVEVYDCTIGFYDHWRRSWVVPNSNQIEPEQVSHWAPLPPQTEQEEEHAG